MENQWIKWGIVGQIQVWQKSEPGPLGQEVSFCATPLSVTRPNTDAYPSENSVTLALSHVPGGFVRLAELDAAQSAEKFFGRGRRAA